MPKRSALLLALLLAGCSQQLKYVQPALPTAPQYSVDGWAASAGPGAVDVNWRSFFQDPRLQGLIEAALVEQSRPRSSVHFASEEARAPYRHPPRRPPSDGRRHDGAARSRNQDFLG
jgi:multidrug efflux system outer membrane protein